MSVEQVKAFFKKLNEDEAFAKTIHDAEAAYTGDKSDKDAAFAAIVLPIAAKAGFNFTVKDFKAAFDTNEEGEASADELHVAAGGAPAKCGKVYDSRDWCGGHMVQYTTCGALATVGYGKPPTV